MKAAAKSRRTLDRNELVGRVRVQLMRRSAPRLQPSIIVALSGAAALISTLYTRLKKRDTSQWTMTVIRRT